MNSSLKHWNSFCSPISTSLFSWPVMPCLYDNLFVDDMCMGASSCLPCLCYNLFCDDVCMGERLDSNDIVFIWSHIFWGMFTSHLNSFLVAWTFELEIIMGTIVCLLFQQRTWWVAYLKHERMLHAMNAKIVFISTHSHIHGTFPLLCTCLDFSYIWKWSSSEEGGVFFSSLRTMQNRWLVYLLLIVWVGNGWKQLLAC